ncbi:hypothetical protein [Streptomyces sp. NPDC090135]
MTAQVLFLAGLACHVGPVLKHRLVDRDRLLRRMLRNTHRPRPAGTMPP